MLAGDAPCRPEIQDDDLALVPGNRLSVPVSVGQRELRGAGGGESKCEQEENQSESSSLSRSSLSISHSFSIPLDERAQNERAYPARMR